MHNFLFITLIFLPSILCYTTEHRQSEYAGQTIIYTQEEIEKEREQWADHWASQPNKEFVRHPIPQYQNIDEVLANSAEVLIQSDEDEENERKSSNFEYSQKFMSERLEEDRSLRRSYQEEFSKFATKRQSISQVPNGPAFDVSGVDERAANGNINWPSDSAICVGPSTVFAQTNSDLALFSKSDILSGDTSPGVSIEALDRWFAGAPANGFDPVCAYDINSNRYFSLAVRGNSPPNNIAVAVSSSSDPSGLSTGWLHSLIGMPGDVGWADYPVMGVDEWFVYFTVNMFKNGRFIRADLYAVNKSQLVAGTSASVSLFPSLSNGRNHPVWSWDTNASKGYMCGTTFSFSGGRIAIHEINNPTGTPTLKTTSIPGSDFIVGPTTASQLGAGAPVNTRDEEIETCQLIGGKLYLTHKIGSSSRDRSRVRWYIIDAASLTIDDSGDIGDAQSWYFFPALVADKFGNVGVGYSRSSTSEFISVYTSERRETDPSGTISPPKRVRSGKTTYQRLFDDGRNRWGDYAAAALDPSDQLTMWYHSQLPTGTKSWQMVVYSNCPGCCENGFTGRNCDEPICDPPCTPNRAECSAPDTCTCIGEWSNPPACDTTSCNPPCTDTAVCNTGNGQCDSCLSGHTGPPSCAGFECNADSDCNGAPKSCTGSGLCCIGPNECRCADGIKQSTYPACDELECPTPCAETGDCQNGVCVCDSGWQGSTCAEPVCEPPCGVNGVCIEPNVCLCNEGWAGEPSCVEAICWGENECVNGKCSSPPDNCECDQGWVNGRNGLCNTTTIYLPDAGGPNLLVLGSVVGGSVLLLGALGIGASLQNPDEDEWRYSKQQGSKLRQTVRRPAPPSANTPWKRFSYRARAAAPGQRKKPLPPGPVRKKGIPKQPNVFTRFSTRFGWVKVNGTKSMVMSPPQEQGVDATKSMIVPQKKKGSSRRAPPNKTNKGTGGGSSRRAPGGKTKGSKGSKGSRRGAGGGGSKGSKKGGARGVSPKKKGGSNRR